MASLSLAETTGTLGKGIALAHYVSCEYLFAFQRSVPWKDCSFAESNRRSLERALNKRDITVPAGQSNMAAIS
jgi:hypothetical protein